MGQYSIPGTETETFDSPNTLFEGSWEASYEGVDKSLEKISKNLDLYSQDGDWYVYSMGAGTKSEYYELSVSNDVDLVYVHSTLKGIYKIFSFIPNYAGLFKIVNPNRIKSIFKTLLNQTMIGLYFVPDSEKKNFINRIKKKHLTSSIDYGIKNSKNYFMYLVDDDNEESSTDIYEIVSCGLGIESVICDYFKSKSDIWMRHSN